MVLNANLLLTFVDLSGVGVSTKEQKGSFSETGGKRLFGRRKSWSCMFWVFVSEGGMKKRRKTASPKKTQANRREVTSSLGANDETTIGRETTNYIEPKAVAFRGDFSRVVGRSPEDDGYTRKKRASIHFQARTGARLSKLGSPFNST